MKRLRSRQERAEGGAMERLQRIFSGAGGMGHPPSDTPLLDSSEQVYISSLALLKMLKHGQWRELGFYLASFVALSLSLSCCFLC